MPIIRASPLRRRMYATPSRLVFPHVSPWIGPIPTGSAHKRAAGCLEVPIKLILYDKKRASFFQNQYLSFFFSFFIFFRNIPMMKVLSFSPPPPTNPPARQPTTLLDGGLACGWAPRMEFYGIPGTLCHTFVTMCAPERTLSFRKDTVLSPSRGDLACGWAPRMELYGIPGVPCHTFVTM